MTKQELLKEIHGLIWKGDDLMEQEVLFKLQEIVDGEILAEAYPNQGKPMMRVHQLKNGFINEIEVL